MQQEHPSVGDVRGVGVFWALDLVRDRASREPIAAATLEQVRTDLLARGLLPFTAGNRLHIVPPCNVTAEEIDEGLAALDEALKIADQTTTTERAL